MMMQFAEREDARREGERWRDLVSSGERVMSPERTPRHAKRYMATHHRRAEAGAVIQPRTRGYNH